ncbi:MAG: GNAT family N-acetyltransferase [Reichenbachiella sp.]|uniref:GNAT family N-acetyltransferase n=1 Tax=Reichenbachiella sp. TaxID=2184521 RepID=UPI0029665928|nr:GNAT family N-acetyltransferase [Reichenbachiella sp.]MDW3212248.1 GNAT family N-acetyltransferase [Reichenbachiella sp.]
MASSLHYRTLTKGDMGQMHRSFVEAFSNYQVNMKMSREAFEDRMLYKLNINFDLSPAVFSGDKLVGFIFQTINEYEGQLAAYNGGTGVIPGYLGQGLTAKLYDFITPQLKVEGVEKCVLEVLTDNDQAIKAYTRSGFDKTKTFQCLMLKDGFLKSSFDNSISVKEVREFTIEEYLALGDINPSMLDQLTQVKYHLAKETILECRNADEIEGYIIFQPKNGRITQLAVDNKHRRNGVGTALVSRAHLLSESKTMSVLNIESKHEGIISFFENLGFTKDLKQFEMQKILVDV